MKKKKANIQIFSETENPIFDFEKTKLIARLKRGQQLKGRGIGFYLTIRREHVGWSSLAQKVERYNDYLYISKADLSQQTYSSWEISLTQDCNSAWLMCFTDAIKLSLSLPFENTIEWKHLPNGIKLFQEEKI
jgi:hypothetical protein